MVGTTCMALAFANGGGYLLDCAGHSVDYSGAGPRRMPLVTLRVCLPL
jgi:hypothetical protein